MYVCMYVCVCVCVSVCVCVCTSVYRFHSCRLHEEEIGEFTGADECLLGLGLGLVHVCIYV